MGIGTNGRGRPRYVADIDLTDGATLFYYDKFYEACRTLCYRDCVALSRAFGISLRAVYAWRHTRNFPRHIGTALKVIDWVREGKPMKQVHPGKVASGML